MSLTYRPQVLGLPGKDHPASGKLDKDDPDRLALVAYERRILKLIGRYEWHVCEYMGVYTYLLLVDFPYDCYHDDTWSEWR